jgi:hypothetical protein
VSILVSAAKGIAAALGVVILLLAIVCLIGYVALGALTVDWSDE